MSAGATSVVLLKSRSFWSAARAPSSAWSPPLFHRRGERVHSRSWDQRGSTERRPTMAHLLADHGGPALADHEYMVPGWLVPPCNSRFFRRRERYRRSLAVLKSGVDQAAASVPSPYPKFDDCAACAYQFISLSAIAVKRYTARRSSGGVLSVLRSREFPVARWTLAKKHHEAGFPQPRAWPLSPVTNRSVI